ncbi:MAG: phosphotriesterase family protein [Planctomycetota bacterium]|jgi:phosphotriesterase-related protein
MPEPRNYLRQFMILPVVGMLFCFAGAEEMPTAVEPISGENIIMTVCGPIAPAEFGKVLVHEHVMCDFIGTAKTGKEPYDADDVVVTMKPYLDAIRERGIKGFVDYTPAWLGRDVEVLARLSELTDVHILTNTGLYGAAEDNFVPSYAYEESAEDLAVRWIKEWKEGIEGTNIRPGFIKTAVDKGPLSEIDQKLVRAAAKTHLQTGLTIACHTGEARAALAVLKQVQNAGVDPSGLIIVHADGIADFKVHTELAKAGAWIEYDGVSEESIKRHVVLIKKMLDAGFGKQLLISHDAGWYRVGEGQAGKEKIRPYTAISDKLIPALKAAGITDAELDKLLIKNPAKAFAVRLRKRQLVIEEVVAR